MWAYRARAHKPFLSFIKGSVTFPGRDREVEVIKKRCFSSHLISRGKVACQAGLTIGNSSFIFFSPALLLCLLSGQEALFLKQEDLGSFPPPIYAILCLRS